MIDPVLADRLKALKSKLGTATEAEKRELTENINRIERVFSVEREVRTAVTFEGQPCGASAAAEREVRSYEHLDDASFKADAERRLANVEAV